MIIFLSKVIVISLAFDVSTTLTTTPNVSTTLLMMKKGYLEILRLYYQRISVFKFIRKLQNDYNKKEIVTQYAKIRFECTAHIH